MSNAESQLTPGCNIVAAGDAPCHQLIRLGFGTVAFKGKGMPTICITRRDGAQLEVTAGAEVTVMEVIRDSGNVELLALRGRSTAISRDKDICT